MPLYYNRLAEKWLLDVAQVRRWHQQPVTVADKLPLPTAGGHLTLTFVDECAKILLLGLICSPNGPSCGSVTRFYYFTYHVPQSHVTSKTKPYPGMPVTGSVDYPFAGEGLAGAHLFSCRLRGSGFLLVGGQL
jgi:hypothetical protein